MANIFRNQDDRRIRAGWRIAIFFFGYSALIMVAALPRLVIGKNIFTSLSAVVAFFIATAVAVWLASRFIDHRDYREFGLGLDKKWWRDLIIGFLIGALLLAVIFVIEYAAGLVTITQLFKNEKEVWVNFPFIPTLLVALFAHTGAALFEETIFRGYMMKNLAEGFRGKRVNYRTPVILSFATSSIIFALFHMRNPNISIFGVVNILLLGLLLGALFILTGEIALSIGLHASWNFFMGVVFGFPISGTEEEIALIATKQGGPSLWTGGTFGPEGGLIGLFAICIGCFLTVLWVRLSRRRLSLRTQLAEYSPSNPRAEKT